MQTATRPAPLGADEMTIEPHPPAPSALVVDVRACGDCPTLRGVGWSVTCQPYIRCGIAGLLSVEATSQEPPAGCPLRSGPVTLRLVDRGRP